MKLHTHRIDGLIAKLNAQYKRIRHPEPGDPPLLTRADAADRHELVSDVLSMPVYVIEQDGRPLEVRRTLIEARECAVKWASPTDRAAHRAKLAFSGSEPVMAWDGTVLRATTIAQLLDELPAHAEHFAELDRERLLRPWW